MTTKVLIVDDDASVLEAITLILQDAGYLVDTTLKGEETYQKIVSFNPDIIMLDVLMSGHDGRDICHRIKMNKQTNQIPVIMMSAHPSASSSTLESGANDFLAKPFELDVLLEKIGKFSIQS